jgi:hypothetical protein
VVLEEQVLHEHEMKSSGRKTRYFCRMSARAQKPRWDRSSALKAWTAFLDSRVISDIPTSSARRTFPRRPCKHTDACFGHAPEHKVSRYTAKRWKKPETPISREKVTIYSQLKGYIDGPYLDVWLEETFLPELVRRRQFFNYDGRVWPFWNWNVYPGRESLSRNDSIVDRRLGFFAAFGGLSTDFISRLHASGLGIVGLELEL